MASLLIAALLLGGCRASTIQITGGPRHADITVTGAELSDRLESLTDEAPEARAKLASLQAREDGATGLAWTSLVLCSVSSGVLGAMPGQDVSNDTRDTLLKASLGFLGGCAAAGLIAALVLPREEEYGAVLAAYNAAFPLSPFSAPQLGVRAAPVSAPARPMAIATISRAEHTARKMSELLRSGELDKPTLLRFTAVLTPDERETFATVWPRYADPGPRADRVLRDVLSAGAPPPPVLETSTATSAVVRRPLTATATP